MKLAKRKRRINYINVAILIILLVILITTIFFAVKLVLGTMQKVTPKKEIQYGEYQVVKEKNFTITKLITKNEQLDKILNENIENVKTKIDTQNQYEYDCKSELLYETIASIQCDLMKEKSVVESNQAMFNILKNENVTYDTLFRNNPLVMKDLFKNVDFDKLNKNKISLSKDKIIVGESDNQLVVEINQYPQIFKSGNGIKSLFNGKPIERKTFTYDKTKKMIAFTYDDGPLNDYHVKIRELFNEYHIPATFYMIGKEMEKREDVVLQTYKDGHTIANHTYTHPGLPQKNLTNIPVDQVRSEYEKTDDVIFKIIGGDATTTRPPGGFIDEKTAQYTTHKQVMWTIDSQDWRYKEDSETVYQNVRKEVRENAIVLFHDLYKSSYEATKRLIPELIKEGYQFVDIDTLLQAINQE